MKPPIRYYGGKVYQAEWICDVLRQYTFHTYIEPFGGSGAILFAKPPSPVEVYNDIHSDLVNMYRVIRNPDTFKEFAEFIENSPYARDIFYESRDSIQNDKSMTDVERAGHFFITFISLNRSDCNFPLFTMIFSADVWFDGTSLAGRG